MISNHKTGNRGIHYTRRSLTGKFIGICGAGGVGKTSTAKALLEHLPDHTFLPSASREVFKEFGVETEAAQHDLSAEKRWQLQKSIQVAHIKKAREYNQAFQGKIISDRTQLDQYAYALQYCSLVIHREEKEWLHRMVEDSLSLYGMIFYFPMHTFPFHGDGMREDRLGPRLQFDFLLRGIITHFRVPVIEIAVEPIATRALNIMDHLSIRQLQEQQPVE